MRSLVLGWLAATALGSACSEVGTAERKVSAADLPTSGATDDGMGWQSAPFPTLDDCEQGGGPSWIELGPKSESRGVVIDHGLGRRPQSIMPYLAFEPDGCRATLGSGDAFVIDYVGDTELKVHNDTDETFYFRIVLR